jgi:hypothetical protein
MTSSDAIPNTVPKTSHSTVYRGPAGGHREAVESIRLTPGIPV